MKHAPAFLALVNDAKSRIKECTVDDLKNRRVPAGSNLGPAPTRAADGLHSRCVMGPRFMRRYTAIV